MLTVLCALAVLLSLGSLMLIGCPSSGSATLQELQCSRKWLNPFGHCLAEAFQRTVSCGVTGASCNSTSGAMSTMKQYIPSGMPMVKSSRSPTSRYALPTQNPLGCVCVYILFLFLFFPTCVRCCCTCRACLTADESSFCRRASALVSDRHTPRLVLICQSAGIATMVNTNRT